MFVAGITLFVLATGFSSGGTTWQVQSLADSGPGTLREAMEAANATGGGDIDCRQLTGVIGIASPLPGMIQNVRFLGPEPAQGVLEVSGGGSWPLLSFGPGTTSVISRLTLSRAVAKDYRHGAAISNAGALWVENCLIVSNRTEGGWGGGIYNAGDLALVEVELRANAALGANGGNSVGLAPYSITNTPGAGGAGFGGAVFQETGTLKVTRSRLIANRASGGANGTYAYKLSDQGNGRGGGPFGGGVGQDGGFGSGGGGVAADSSVGQRSGFGGGSSGPTSGDGGFGGGLGSSGDLFFNYPRPGAGAGMGGGIFVRGGLVDLQSSVFITNVAEGGIIQTQGGGSGQGVGASLMVYGGEVRVDRCRFKSGNARMAAQVRDKLYDSGGGNCRGGGIALIDGGLTMSSSVLLSNRVVGGAQGADGLGGGFYQYGGTSRVSQVSWVGNEAFGGTPGSARASFSLPAGAGMGGGAWIEGGRAEFENCTLANNLARGADNYVTGQDSPTSAVRKLGRSIGAGLGVSLVRGSISTTVLLRHCTVAGNKAERSLLSYTYLPVKPEPLGETLGGGIYVDVRGGVVQLSGTLSAENEALEGPDILGTIQSIHRNLLGKTLGAVGWSASDLVDVDARLGPLQSQGPYAWVRVPLTNSPAVDAADPVDLPPLDQRWIVRPQGAAGDIGAVELTEDPGAPAARFAELSHAPDGRLTFRVTGQANWTHRLERSVDLRTWVESGPLNVGEPLVIPLEDIGAVYRVRSQPSAW